MPQLIILVLYIILRFVTVGKAHDRAEESYQRRKLELEARRASQKNAQSSSTKKGEASPISEDVPQTKQELYDEHYEKVKKYKEVQGKAGFPDYQAFFKAQESDNPADAYYGTPPPIEDLAPNGILIEHLNEKARADLLRQKKIYSKEHREKKIPIALVCLNCGAPLNKINSKCEYCGAENAKV